MVDGQSIRVDPYVIASTVTTTVNEEQHGESAEENCSILSSVSATAQEAPSRWCSRTTWEQNRRASHTHQKSGMRLSLFWDAVAQKRLNGTLDFGL